MSKQTVVVCVGGTDLHFEAGHDDLNRFLNDANATDKVTPAFNFLSRTVVESDREAFGEAVMADAVTPKGVVVLQISQIVTAELGGTVEISLKKPSV